jgi:IclR family acetate operon transcriptional repressor
MHRPALQDTSSSLQRALALLDAFSGERGELSVRQLAERSGVARSTAHRLSQELVDWGGLERTPRGLRLGVKLFELGAMAPSPTSLRETAVPYLHTLHEVTQLTANLAVREGTEIVYLEKISSRRLRVPHTRLGGRGTLHATALGKAIMAFSSDETDFDALAPTMRPLTPHTIVDPVALRRELGRVRARRVAYDVEESNEGLFCVAAPIIGPGGSAIGACSVTGATALAVAERFAPTVMATAAAISRDLHRTSE